ncbi:MAG: hypothetical protein AB7J28_15410 [Hyphomonadaceae bacterium]
MAATPQRGPGIGVNLVPVVPGINPTSRYYGYNTSVDQFVLGSGELFLIPPGQWMVSPGPYSFIQVLDPVTGLWRTTAQTPNGGARFVSSDGTNYRVANLSGCALGSFITNVGSGYTSAPTVTASAGSSAWTAIVGGAINTTVTIATAGAGYSHKPILLIEPPPAGGVQATAVAAVTAGAISSVTVIDQGAGYTSAPRITVLPDPRDTVTTQAALTTALTGSGTITAIVCTDPGTPLTSVPTLTISGGGGASGAATVVMCFTATGFTVGAGGAAYGNAQPFLVQAVGGRVAGTAGAVVNPSTGVGLLTPRTGFITGTSEAGGAVTATGAVIEDGGLFARVPSGFVTAGGSGLATTVAQVTITVGGVNDVLYLQPA